jgi:hypothetical protein
MSGRAEARREARRKMPCLKTIHSFLILVVDAEKFGCCVLRESPTASSRREASMKAQWDRALVVATLAMAIIVCLWGIKILVMA